MLVEVNCLMFQKLILKDLHFLEPLSCVIQSWNLSEIDIKKGDKSFGIVGGGPIGCLHTLYLNENNSENQITIIESNR